MGKLNQDFTTWKGNYREIIFYVEDVDTVEGSSAAWAMSTSSSGSTLILKTSEANSGITFSGKNIIITLNPGDTSEISPGNYYHELRLEDILNQPTTPAIGTITLKDTLLKTNTG